MEPADVATSLLRAFNDGNLDRMRQLMDPAMVAWVTDASRAAEPVVGADAYLDRIAAMDLPAVRYRVSPTQSPVAIEDDLVLLMVEVHAERDDRRLENSPRTCSGSPTGASLSGGWRTPNRRETGSGPEEPCSRTAALRRGLTRRQADARSRTPR